MYACIITGATAGLFLGLSAENPDARPILTTKLTPRSVPAIDIEAAVGCVVVSTEAIEKTIDRVATRQTEKACNSLMDILEEKELEEGGKGDRMYSMGRSQSPTQRAHILSAWKHWQRGIKPPSEESPLLME